MAIDARDLAVAAVRFEKEADAYIRQYLTAEEIESAQVDYRVGMQGGKNPASAVRINNQGSWVEDKMAGKWKYAGNSSNVLSGDIQDNTIDYLDYASMAQTK